MSDQSWGDSNGVNNNEDKDLQPILKGVSFCFPIVGAVLYFVWKNDRPRASKSACTFALIGFAIGLVLQILVTVMGVAVG